MARIQLKIWHAPLSVLSSPPPVGLAEGEVAIAIETNSLVKRPDGNDNAPLITLNGDVNFVRARVATTTNITLAGLQTIDGVFLNAGEIVLVKNQTDPKQNGIYSAAVGEWPRHSSSLTVESLGSVIVVVEAGTDGSESIWIPSINRDQSGAIGSMDIEFTKPSGAGSSAGGLPAGSGPNGELIASDIGGVNISTVGAPNGVAPLDSKGKVPSTYLNGGVPNGTATLDGNGDVPSTQLPVGLPGGVAGLDNNRQVPSVNLPVATGNIAGVVMLGEDFALVNGKLTYVGNAGGAAVANAAQAFEFTVNFAGSNPSSVTDLPDGWTASISGTDVTVSHTAGKALKTVQYWGVSTIGGLERYRLPSASYEVSIPLSYRESRFVIRVSTAVTGADADGRARIVATF